MLRQQRTTSEDKKNLKEMKTLTSALMRYLLSYLLRLLHGSRVETTSVQSPQEEMKGTSYKKSTAREETTTSTSNLGLQCSDNIGALRHHCHYEWHTSCDLKDDIREEEDILATCLHLYDVDIKDGEHHMLNLPQPRLPTATVFDGTTPAFPEWAREVRAYLNINQLEHIDLLDFANDAEVTFTTDIMVQQTVAGRRRHQETARLTQACQDLRDERALSPGDPQRRGLGVIDGKTQQIINDLNAHRALQDATTAGVRRADELLGYLITHSTKPNSESNNLLRRLRRTNIGWEAYRQLRHEYAAGARVQQYTLLQSIVYPQPRWTDTSQQQQFQNWIQDVSAYKMIHPVIDDALKLSTVISNLHGPIQHHLLLQVRPHHTWPEVCQMVDNSFANNYTHLPGQTIGNINQDINLIENKKGKGKKGKGIGKKGKGKGYNHNNYYNYNYNHYNSYYNQQQHQPQHCHNRKAKEKEKASSGATTTTTPARARTSRSE